MSGLWTVRVCSARRRLVAAASLSAILALGAALRFFNLTGQSLWNDEGTSVALAGRSLSQITLSAAADIHPPLYHYLLHYWLGLFGSSDYAARSLSAVLGVGLVGLTYLLGQRLFGRRTGLIAALVAAVSPYQVYYAQEARMYMLLAFLGAASTYLFYLGWIEPEPQARWRGWAMAGWAAVSTLAAYTHYLAAALVLAQNVAWVAARCLAWRRGETSRPELLRSALTWAGAQAAVGALYAPWLALTWAQLHRWPAVSQPFGLATLLKRALPLFALGPSVPASSLGGVVVGVMGLTFLGVVLPGRRGRRDAGGRLLALLYWVTPVAVLYYLSQSRPVYHPKFLLLAAPGFTLLLGRGLGRLLPEPDALGSRRLWLQVGVACCAGLLALSAAVPGLRNYYFDPRYARDDYRGIAEYISAVGRPGDVVLINAPSQIETVARYYPGPLPMTPIPIERPPDRDETAAKLAQLARKARRIFGIFWATNESDPERLVEGWLDAHAYKALDAWYGNVRLVVYAVPSMETGDETQHPLSVDLGGRIRLEGYSLASEEVASGDILQLTLFWRATNVIRRRYKVFTHVLDADGHVVGQRDSEPCGGSSFTNTWQEGQQVIDRYGLPIPPGTPPGDYVIEVGMYDPGDGLRLPIVEGGEVTGDHVILQTVRVVRPAVPPPPAALGMQHRRTIKGDEVQLLGFSFGRAGSPERDFSPGDVAELVLFWQALREPQDELRMLVRIVDRSGRVRLERDVRPSGARYPVRQWQAGEVVRGIAHLHLPADLAPGRYRLLLGWQSISAGRPEPPFNELLAFVVE